MVQGRNQGELSSGVFVGVLNKGRVPPGSVQGLMMWALEHLLWCKRGSSQNASAPGSRCQLGPVIRAFEDGQHLALCHARPDIWAQGFLSVHPHEKKLA